MIGTINIRCNAAKPNFPLQPMFAFMGSPSSIRVLDVPKSIGSWEITSVRVAVLYPNNLTIEKVAVRTGSVWVATFDGCEVAGKVGNGLSILADGVDEDGNEVSGYVLGKGDVFILENDSDVKRLLEKYTVRYLDEVPAAPSVGDLLNINGQIRLFDGESWLYISNGGEPTVVNDSEIKIKENGTEVGSFTLNQAQAGSIDIPVPSRTSDIKNDVGYITANALPTKVSELENDSGFITLAQVPTPSYIEDASGNKIEADLTYSNLNWTGWRIEGTDEILTGEKSAANDMPTNPELWDEYFSLTYDTENSEWKLFLYTWNSEWTPIGQSQTSGTLDDTTISFPGWKTLVQVNESGKLATNSELPTKTSDLVNDSGFITASAIPSQISSFENDVGFITASQVQPYSAGGFQGYARNALGAILVYGRDSTGMSPDENVYATFDVSNRKLVRAEQSYYPWVLSMYNGTTFDPPLEMTYGYRGVVAYKANGRVRSLQVNSNCWLAMRTVGTTVTPYYIKAVEDEYGQIQPDENFYTTATAHPITFSTNKLSIETIDGESGNITCTRQNTGTYIISQNYYAYEDAIPSNVSQLTNDAGYITASAIPSNISSFNNDVGYLTASSSAFTAKRDKTDLVYKVGFDKDNLDKVVKFVVEYVDGSNQNVTATLDKYDEFTQTWTGDNTNWKVFTYLVGMESELYFALNDGTGEQDGQPAPSQGAEDTSWNFTYNGNPATWTMVMTQNIAIQQDFKNLRNMKDISYPASVDSTGMYTIQKFNVNGTEVAHFTASGSTSTWDTNNPVVNQYEISTTDGTNFTMVSNGIQIGTFTMTNLKNGVVDVTYDGNTYTVGATFKQTTLALKDYVDAQIGSINTALDTINGEVI